MAIKEESLAGVPSRKALATLLGLDTARTYKVTVTEGDAGLVPALAPVVISGKTAKTTRESTTALTLAEGDKLGFLASDRVADENGEMNAAVMVQAHVRFDRLSAPAQAAIKAAKAVTGALDHIVIEGEVA